MLVGDDGEGVDEGVGEVLGSFLGLVGLGEEFGYWVGVLDVDGFGSWGGVVRYLEAEEGSGGEIGHRWIERWVEEELFENEPDVGGLIEITHAALTNCLL